MKFDDLVQNEMLLDAASRMTSGKNPYNLPMGTVSSDGVAVVGRNGHMFITGGTNNWAGQWKGQVGLGVKGIAMHVEQFRKRIEICKESGADFFYLIVPEKQSAIPQFHPESNLGGGEARPIIRLMNSLPYGRNFFYGLEFIVNHTSGSGFWFRGDSHWCLSGLWIIVSEFLKRAIPGIALNFEDIPIKRISRVHDLTSKFESGANFYEEIVWVGHKGVVTKSHKPADGRLRGSIIVSENSNAENSQSICIFGDSYAIEGMFSLLCCLFKKVHYYRWPNVVESYVSQERPDIVILEQAERFISEVYLQS